MARLTRKRHPSVYSSFTDVRHHPIAVIVTEHYTRLFLFFSSESLPISPRPQPCVNTSHVCWSGAVLTPDLFPPYIAEQFAPLAMWWHCTTVLCPFTNSVCLSLCRFPTLKPVHFVREERQVLEFSRRLLLAYRRRRSLTFQFSTACLTDRICVVWTRSRETPTLGQRNNKQVPRLFCHVNEDPVR